MTPDQRRLSAEHARLVLARVRRGRWRNWSEAESTALEVLCVAAQKFDGRGTFAGYLGANLDRWLLDQFRSWTHVKASDDRLLAVDCRYERGPEALVVDAATARDELGQVTANTLRVAHLVASGMKKEDIASLLGVTPSAVSHALRSGQRCVESYRRVAA